MCPNGHRNWEPTNHHFWCETCARHYDTDGVFHDLLNKQTGETHERDQLELVTPVGTYRDVHREGSA